MPQSPNKEPCFLAKEFQYPNYPRSESEYLALFSSCRFEKRVGEATTTYLVSASAAESIRQFCPEAKIIVMLRNPVEMIHSLHGQRVIEGVEDIADFDAALAAETARRNGNRIPRGLRYPKEYLQYRQFGRYAEQVSRYLDVFGAENVHIIIFDDLCRSAESEYKRACTFLGIIPERDVDFSRVNEGRMVWSVSIHRALVNAPQSLPASIRQIANNLLVGRVINLGRRVLMATNRRKGRRPMSAVTRRELREYYRDDVARLGALIGRDLGGWLSEVAEPLASG
jgi:hypothetical protein